MEIYLFLLLFLIYIAVWAFVLLFPFYLRDKGTKLNNGVWLLIGELLRIRFYAVLVLNLIIGPQINVFVGTIMGKPIVGFILMTLYLILIIAVFLYPFYLKDNKPEKYTGLLKSFAEWLGDPRDI